jgi:hypothetical protein
MRTLSALLLVAFASLAAAQAPQVSSVELQRCGLYESREAAREDDPQSPSGKRRIVHDNRLTKETLSVPARPGTKFGCEIVLHGAPEGAQAQFRAVLRLPPGAPRESLAGSQTYPIGGVGYVGYTFRNPALLVAGPWTLQIWVQEKKLAEKTFSVTR